MGVNRNPISPACAAFFACAPARGVPGPETPKNRILAEYGSHDKREEIHKLRMKQLTDVVELSMRPARAEKVGPTRLKLVTRPAEKWNRASTRSFILLKPVN